MKIQKSLRAHESGIAHLGLIVAVLLVVGAAGFATYRVISSNNEVSASEIADEDFDEIGSDTEDSIQESDDEVSADDAAFDGPQEEGENAI